MSLMEYPPSVWTFLIALVTAIPTTIAALAAYRKIITTSAQTAKKLDVVHGKVNGRMSELRDRADYLAHRLSLYEQVPYRNIGVINEGHSQPGRGYRGRGDVSGPSGQRGGDEEPFQRDW